MPGLAIPEIIEIIIDHLHDNKHALASCSTVSRVWLPRSRYHLFRTIEIIICTPDRNLYAASAFFNATPSVCGYVRHVHIRAATVMALRTLGTGDFACVWPIPQKGAALQKFCELLRALTIPVSVDLEGVYLAPDPQQIAKDIDDLVAPALRKLTMREVLIPTESFLAFYNPSTIFTNLQDLSLVNMLFDSTFSFSDVMPCAGDFHISRLMLRSAQTLLGILPSTAFRYLRYLEMPMLSLLIPDAARFLTPLYDTLEDLTLSVGQFGLNDMAPNAFDLASCEHLHSLHFTHSLIGRTSEPAAALTLLANVSACLRLAPSHLQHITIALLPYSDESMNVVVRAPGWETMRSILTSGMFDGLKSVRVVCTLPDPDYYPKEVGESMLYTALAPLWQKEMKERFGRVLEDKLIFV